jgi:hypothetical protein
LKLRRVFSRNRFRPCIAVADLSHKDNSLFASPEFTITYFFVLLLICATSTPALTAYLLCMSANPEYDKQQQWEAMNHYVQADDSES